MKKHYFKAVQKSLLIFIGIFSLNLNAQVTIFSENFSGSSGNFLPSGWVSSGDFYAEDGTGMPPGYATCTVSGSSGGYMLASYDGVSGTTESAESPVFSTLGKSNMTMNFNALLDVGSTRTFSLFFSVDGGATYPILVPFTNVSNNGAWAAVPSITLPSSIDGFTSVKFKIAFTSNNTGDFYAVDDIIITGLTSPIFYYNGVGQIDNLASWGTAGNGTGTPPTSFSAQAQTFYFTNAPSINLSNMAGTSISFTGSLTTVHVGTGTTSINLTIPTTHTLFVGSTTSLQVNNQATLTLQNITFPTANVNIQTGSLINYAQTAGIIAPISSAHYNMTISGGADIQAAGDFTVNNNFNATNGSYKMNGTPIRSLYLNGPISTSGGFIKTGNSILNIGGSGAIGTVNFAAGATTFSINKLFLNRAGQTLTLGSDLSVTSTASLSNGNINLNGKTLKLNGATTFPASAAAGVFIGSGSSNLTLGGTGALTNGLFMDQSSSSSKTIKALNLTKTGSTLNLGNSIEITDSVKITGATLNTGGNLTLKSTLNLKGRIAEISSGGSLSGNVTVETFAKGGSAGWAQLGVSGVSGQTFNSWYGQIPMTIEGSATGVTSAGGYYFESVQGWKETDPNGYDTTIVVTDPLVVGKGYWVYLASSTSSAADKIWTVTGAPVTGPVIMPVTNTPTVPASVQGYNLVSNPYASPISWTKLRNGNLQVADAIYVYNADLGTSTSYVGGFGTNGGTDVIPMGQGFYVQALNNTSLISAESNKVSNNTVANQLLKTASPSANIGLTLKLKINGNAGESDETGFRFHSAATSTFDAEWDANKLFTTPGYAGYPGAYSHYTSISSKGTGNVDYSINSLPIPATQSVSIPVLVKVASTGIYTISPIDLQNLPDPSCVVLRDKLLNVNHSLANGPYICSINDTTSAARFELNICAQGITTGVSNNSSASVANTIFINQDNDGAVVNTIFAQNTKAVISVYNIVGQKLMENITVNGTATETHLNLDLHNQVVLIRVTTDKESVTKKIVLH
ncbi:MAG: hypothetical protein JWO32_2495 [Bacteroidetes bacterium]|nr:hypothetical protein [Bacteroidota bacterium]